MRRPALLVVFAVVALTVVAALSGHLPVRAWLSGTVAYIRDAGTLGVLLFATVYVVAAVFFLPGAVLTLGAGFAYGPVLGVLIVSPVSVLAASVAFLVGRFVAREWIGRRIAGDPRFAAIDDAIANDGFRIVMLLRLSPLFPFSLLNYALGLTKVSFRDYVVASWIGMLPATVLYVYLGSLVTNLGDLTGGRTASGSGAAQALYWVGLVATVLIAVVATRTARRALASALASREHATEARPTPMESR
jgi:uncharacterized membrane protein YdjX (TVP38/TMEM64 family)